MKYVPLDSARADDRAWVWFSGGNLSTVIGYVDLDTALSAVRLYRSHPSIRAQHVIPDGRGGMVPA